MAAKKKPVKVEEIKVLRGPKGRFISPSKAAPAKKTAPAKKAAPSKKSPSKGSASDKQKLTLARRRGRDAAKLESRAKELYASKAADKDVNAVNRLRSAALRVRARSKLGGLSKKASELAKAHGIMRVNPSAQPISSQLKALSMDLLWVGGSAWTVSKLGCMAKEASAKAKSPFVQKYGVTLATGGATVAAYLAARMVAPRYSSAVLLGGTAATVVHALVATKNEEGVSMGRRLFPEALQGYVTLDGIPSVEDFANPTAMDVLDEAEYSGSLSGSIF